MCLSVIDEVALANMQSYLSQPSIINSMYVGDVVFELACFGVAGHGDLTLTSDNPSLPVDLSEVNDQSAGIVGVEVVGPNFLIIALNFTSPEFETINITCVSGMSGASVSVLVTTGELVS